MTKTQTRSSPTDSRKPDGKRPVQVRVTFLRLPRVSQQPLAL